jgi:hypothetical protein
VRGESGQSWEFVLHFRVFLAIGAEFVLQFGTELACSFRVRKARKTGISFGNFVFLGLRSNSGIKDASEGDLYLRGEDGLRVLTDYRCCFVVQAAHYVR